MNQLIVIALDGNYQIEGEFGSIEQAWNRAADMGSRWYFYPLSVVAKNGVIIDTPEGFEYLKNTKLENLSILAEAIQADLELLQ